MAEQTQAQRLADALEEKPDSDGHCRQAAAELRRLEAVNAQLLDSVQVAVDSDLGRLWVWPETAQETWMKNARTAIKAAKGEA